MDISLLMIVLLLAAYVIGSIPSGFIIARIKGIADIRQHGSGNIGATNVGRFLGHHYFCIILICDAFKAYAFLSFLHYFSYSESFLIMVGAALLLGNAYSIFLRGDGGKGVATLFGIVCALSHYLALLLLIIWAVVVIITRRAAIASLVSVTALSIGAWFLHTQLFVSSFCAVLFIFWRHRKNIYSFF